MTKNTNNKKFLDPQVTVDIVVFVISPEKKELDVLLIERANPPFKGAYALPGGFLFKGETTKTAAERVLKDKAGVDPLHMEQLYTFDAEGRDPRGPVFSVTYMALVNVDKLKITDVDGTQKPKLFNVKKLPKLAFDHKDILRYSIKRLKGKIEYTNISALALPSFFTLTELQGVYETVLGKELDKRNFRKKILDLEFVTETKKMATGLRRRPAKLYKTKHNKLIELDKFM